MTRPYRKLPKGRQTKVTKHTRRKLHTHPFVFLEQFVITFLCFLRLQTETDLLERKWIVCSCFCVFFRV